VYELPKFILAVLAEQDVTFGCSYIEKVPNIVMFIMSLVSCVSMYFDILFCKYNLNIVRKLPNEQLNRSAG
jgi:hypothetical protein